MSASTNLKLHSFSKPWKGMETCLLHPFAIMECRRPDTILPDLHVTESLVLWVYEDRYELAYPSSSQPGFAIP